MWSLGSPAADRDQTIEPVTLLGSTETRRTQCSCPASSTTWISRPAWRRRGPARCRAWSPMRTTSSPAICSQETKSRGMSPMVACGAALWRPRSGAQADPRSVTLRSGLVVERSAGLRVTTEDGVRLAVTVSGGGEPLVMIPGLGATHRVYAPIVPALENSFTVIVYEPRG